MLAQTIGILFFFWLCFVEGMLGNIMLQSPSTKRKHNLCLETGSVFSIFIDLWI